MTLFDEKTGQAGWPSRVSAVMVFPGALTRKSSLTMTELPKWSGAVAKTMVARIQITLRFSSWRTQKLICSLLNINIYPFVIIFLNQIFLKYKFFSFYTLFKIMILVMIKNILEILIKGFTSDLNVLSEKDNQFISSNDSEKFKQN